MNTKKVHTFTNTITLHAVLGNLLRPRHALIVLRDTKGNYLLGSKPKLYPEHIFRLIGGGIDDSENPIEGAVREIQEELQLQVTSENLTPIAEIITTGTLENTVYKNTTYLYELVVKDIERLVPSDDIEALESMNRDELQALIERYKNLSHEFRYKTDDGYGHCWGDYGEMYSFIHQKALDLTN
jgi:8-oxo-dGTP pyrophosphatase MutT (NUDIX family)